MKKAQAAMEFLMTYGWAILVVLVAIAALAYFGVLNPGKFLPKSCTIGAGIACTDFKVMADGSATIIVRNGLGSNIESVSMTLGGVVATTDPATITDGNTATYVWAAASLPTGTAGSKYKADIVFTYTAEGSTLSHSETGSLTTKYE
ncbi:MAG: hypothetical protein NTZ02_02535 [Candidatus Woesearchaeota archaeon]|jgi:uncharacterized protein (UPF0333 family)|nr:hypothetical protein [Candidatus Woesearchaeota archaeon]